MFSRCAQAGFLLLVGFAIPSLGDCLSNFHSGGTLIKKVYTTSDEIAGVDVKTAMRRLITQLPGQEVKVISSDAEKGDIVGQNDTKGQPVFPVILNVTKSLQGVAVKLRIDLPTGVFGSRDTARMMCDTIALAAKETSPADVPPRGADRRLTGQFTAPNPGLSNEDVIKMSAADLGDDIVIAKINAASSVSFDTSTDGLVSLKNHKVSKRVIQAMLARESSLSTTDQPAASRGKSTSQPERRTSSPAPNTPAGANSTDLASVSAPLEQIEADLLSTGRIEQGAAYILFTSPADFQQIRMVRKQEGSAIRQYDVAMVLPRANIHTYEQDAAASIQETQAMVWGGQRSSPKQQQRRPIEVNLTLLYTKNGNSWKLTSTKVGEVKEAR